MVVLAGRIWSQLRVDDDQPVRKIAAEPGADVVLDVDHSDRLRVANRGSTPEDLATRIRRTLERFASVRIEPIDHNVIDETNILNRWLYRQAGHPAILPLDLDRRDDADYLTGLATRMLGLDPQLIAADFRQMDDTEDGEAVVTDPDDGIASTVIVDPDFGVLEDITS
jgi:hypothetical protein